MLVGNKTKKKSPDNNNAIIGNGSKTYVGTIDMTTNQILC